MAAILSGRHSKPFTLRDFVLFGSLKRRVARKGLRDDRLDTATSLIHVAIMLSRRMPLSADSQRLYESALSMHEKIFEKEHLTTAYTLVALTGFWEGSDDPRYAQELYERPLAIRQDKLEVRTSKRRSRFKVSPK